MKNKKNNTTQQTSTKRSCGDCQACCNLMGVQELGKPYASKCQHQCPGGCAIYAARPQGCKDYECTWKLNHSLSTEWRPNTSGILLFHDHYDDARAKSALWVCEVWPNAILAMPFGLAEWINSYGQKKGNTVILVRYGVRRGTSYRIAARYAQDSHQKHMGLRRCDNERNFLALESLDGTDEMETAEQSEDRPRDQVVSPECTPAESETTESILSNKHFLQEPNNV
jgi:hypothetical protein